MMTRANDLPLRTLYTQFNLILKTTVRVPFTSMVQTRKRRLSMLNNSFKVTGLVSSSKRVGLTHTVLSPEPGT